MTTKEYQAIAKAIRETREMIGINPKNELTLNAFDALRVVARKIYTTLEEIEKMQMHDFIRDCDTD